MNWTVCVLSFRWFPSIWILCADVLEHSVCSIFIACHDLKWNSVLKHCHIKFRCWVNHPKERIQHSQQGESLKSRIRLLSIERRQNTIKYRNVQQHSFISSTCKCVQKYVVQNWNGMVFWWRQSVNFGCPFMHFYRKTLHVFKAWFTFI